MRFYVYELVTVPDGIVCYVGKGTKRRMYIHKRNLANSRYQQTGLYRRLRELLNSGKNFEPRKVFETDDETQALKEEKRRIQFYGFERLFNSTTHQGATVAAIDEMTRQAMQKARNEYVVRLQQKRGYKMPPSVRRKISAGNKGRIDSAALRAKRVATWKSNPANIEQAHRQALTMGRMHAGKKRSRAYCAKLSKLRKGQLITWGAAISKGLMGKASRHSAKSKYRGVTWFGPKKAWQCRIQIDGVTKMLGQFKLESDAAWIYDNAFETFHGARPNSTPKEHKITRFRLGLHGKLVPVS